MAGRASPEAARPAILRVYHNTNVPMWWCTCHVDYMSIAMTSMNVRKYTPAESGFFGYGRMMIKDWDRAMQYSIAMSEALISLKGFGATNLLVLDFGAGTGLLSGLLHKIAAHHHITVHTVLVDCNNDLLEMARVLLTEQGLSENEKYNPTKPKFTGHFTIHHGSCSKLRRHTNVFDTKVDFVVSEILGTFASSESVVEYYFNNVTPLVKVIGNTKHAIPRKIEQYASLYSDSIFVPTKQAANPMSFIMYGFVNEILTAHSQLTTRCKSPEGRISVMNDPLPDHETLPSNKVTIYAAEYIMDGTISIMEPRTKDLFGEVSVDSSIILAFEWKAWLFGNIVLSNTVKHANMYRQGAWGIPYAYLVPDVITKSITGRCNVSWPTGSIQPVHVKLVASSKEEMTLMKKHKSEDILSSDDEDDVDDLDYVEAPKRKREKKRAKS